jgi:very-short-patch-repair endonuclease
LNYIAVFICKEFRLVIEVDGITQQRNYREQDFMFSGLPMKGR